MSGLSYLIQIPYQALGTKSATRSSANPGKDPTFVISPATLTAAYSGNVSSAVSVAGMSQVDINVQYVAGTNPSLLNLKFEFSGDEAAMQAPVNWFQETTESVAIGTTSEFLQVRKFDNNASLVGGTTYSFRITMSVADKFMRVSAQETLTSGVGFGTVYVEVIASGR